jgi:hypothetical protein
MMDDEVFPHGLSHSEWETAFDQIHTSLGMERT